MSQVKKGKRSADLGERSKKRIVRFFTNNWKTKLLSVVFALFFWIFVLSTDTSVTRERSIEVPLTIQGEERLDENTGLVISTNRSDIPETVNVTVATSVADALKVDASTVRASVDLSNVTMAGERNLLVSVQANDENWNLKSVEPSSITLDFDKRATIEVPIQAILTGELSEGYWQGVPAITPESIPLVGSETELERVERIVCRVDLTDQKLPIERAVSLEALDAGGNVIDDANFVDGLPRGVFSLPIYPKKTVPLDTGPALITSVFIAEGYTLEGLRPSVNSVTIAGPQDVLDDIQSIPISIPRQPGDREENTQSFSTAVALQIPEDVVWSNYKEVSVWIQIGEVRDTVMFDDFAIGVRGEGNGLKANIIQPEQSAQITLSGPKTILDKIRRRDVSAYVDASNYGVGFHTLPVEIELPEEYADSIEVSVMPSERSVNIISD